MGISLNDENQNLNPSITSVSNNLSLKFPLSSTSNFHVSTLTLSGMNNEMMANLKLIKAFMFGRFIGFMTIKPNWHQLEGSFGMQKELDENSSGKIKFIYHGKESSLNVKATQIISESWNGSVGGTIGLNPSVKLNINTGSTNRFYSGQLTLHPTNVNFSVVGSARVSERSSLTVSASINNQVYKVENQKSLIILYNNWSLDLGFDKAISNKTNIIFGFGLGDRGIYFKFGLRKDKNTFFIPLLVSSWFQSLVIGLGFFVARIATNFIYRKRIQKAQQASIDIGKARAQSQCSMIAEEVAQKKEIEDQKGGLVIVHAFFGKHPDQASQDLNDDENDPTRVDITIPLQYMVQDSKLIISEQVDKTLLYGFYDPEPGHEKWMEVVYFYRNQIHRVLVSEFKPLLIPLVSHKVVV